MLIQDDEIFEETFGLWVPAIPEAEVNLLDLLYLERRMGVWATSMLTLKKTAADVVPPKVWVHLLERGLGVVRAQRRGPYEPYDETVRRHDHRLLDVPFNMTRIETVQRLIARCLPLPWRVKNGLRLVS